MRNRHFLTKIKKATKIWILTIFIDIIWIFSTKHTRNTWILYWLYPKKQYYQKQHLNKSVRGEKAGLPLPSNVEGISSNILLILTAKNYNTYEQSQKSCTLFKTNNVNLPWCQEPLERDLLYQQRRSDAYSLCIQDRV